MAARTSTIPRSAAATLLLDAGSQRVGKGAADELVKELECKADEIGKKAIKAAQHAGRKTVTADDIKLAMG
jgi:histone H3/H4